MSAGLTPATLRDRDARARLAAQTVFDRPLVLEAGAGTGKTATLVARIVAWCLGSGWERALVEERAALAGTEKPARERVGARVLDGVVAITFTEAAAAEMAARVGQTLRALALGRSLSWLAPEALPADEDERTERARALVVCLDHLTASTIHAFCRRVLARNPLAAGLHPFFVIDPDDERLADVARDVVASALPSLLGERPDPDALALVVAGFGPPALAEGLVTLVQHGVQVGDLGREPFPPAAIEALLHALRLALANFSTSGGEALRLVPQNATKTHRALESLDTLTTLAASATIAWRDALADVCERVREAWQGVAHEKLGEWRRGELGKGERKVLGENAPAVSAAAGQVHRAAEALSRLRPLLLDQARHVLGPLLAEVLRRLRIGGIEGFEALLADARDVLVQHPEVAARERRVIRQLLVDEFQDTDIFQCELLAALALSGPVGERPGLFLVGDPKQSIYGWRNADLAAYEGFVERVLEGGAERHTLSVNFRSVPAILAEVDEAIAPVMRAQAGVQPGYEQLVACEARAKDQGFARGSWASVEYWVSWRRGEDTHTPGTTLARDAVALEADAVARDMRRLHDEEGVAWRELGVLLRAGSDLEGYLGALRREAVPFVVERDRSYYQRREIVDAAAFVRVVLDPYDQIALVTWLRSSWVGVPDAALVPLWQRRFPALVSELDGEHESALARLREVVIEVAAYRADDEPGLAAPAGWEHALNLALDQLEKLRREWQHQPAVRFVESLRSASQLETSEAARTLGGFRIANLGRFFRQLRDAIEESGWDREAVLRSLRRAVAERREAEEARPRDVADDAVRVMTIHKSKGLDFGHVYLVQAHRGTRSDSPRACDAARLEGGMELVLCGAPTLGWPLVEERRAAVAQAELVRTLYVAMTRARDRLVVVGNWQEREEEGNEGNGGGRTKGSQLDLLTHRKPESLARLWSELGEKGRHHADANGARWVFPALLPTSRATRHSEERAALPPVGEVERQAGFLREQRRVAAERMARPFSTPLSAMADDAGHLAEERLAGEEAGGEPRQRSGKSESTGRQAAAVGTAVHRVIERLDLRSDVAAQLATHAKDAAVLLSDLLGAKEIAPAAERLRTLLACLGAPPFAERLRDIAAHMVGREIPVLLPTGDDPGAPVGFHTGAIDLVYRDPGQGELVVVDFKTDALANDAEASARADVYEGQVRAYAEALRQFARLPRPPLVELWFLAAGRIVRLE